MVSTIEFWWIATARGKVLVAGCHTVGQIIVDFADSSSSQRLTTSRLELGAANSLGALELEQLFHRLHRLHIVRCDRRLTICVRVRRRVLWEGHGVMGTGMLMREMVCECRFGDSRT